MARPRTLSDEDLIGHILAALAEGGPKAASFGQIAHRSGLAPATLAQRFGSVDAMQRGAMLAEWARLTAALQTAEGDALITTKGVQALLKMLPSPPLWLVSASMTDSALADAAIGWRMAAEQAIASRRSGAKSRETAALIFAAWQGRLLWEAAGGKGFRLSDLMKAVV